MFLSTGYPATKTEDKKANILLHKIIHPTEKGFFTDHINRIKTDNRRSNLRTVTFAQNNQNSKQYDTSKSGYKGVYPSGKKLPAKQWVAQIKPYRKSMHLGSFDTKEEAAKCYNEAAIKYFGKYAFLNVIPEK